MIQNLITGFLVGLGVGGMGVLAYVGHKNKGFERYIQQLTNEHTVLQGQYAELEKRYQVMQATKAAQKITAPIEQPSMTWIGPDEVNGSQLYERFGGPEQ